MTPAEEKLTAALLRLASDKFSNHGCNDYWLEATPEHIALVEAMNIANGELAEDACPRVQDGKICAPDFALMDAMADKLALEDFVDYIQRLDKHRGAGSNGKRN